MSIIAANKVTPLEPSAAHLAETRPFPSLGITLGGIDAFVKRCGGRAALEGLTTTDVCEQFVKPQTVTDELSYCDVVARKNDQSVGPAKVFIR